MSEVVSTKEALDMLGGEYVKTPGVSKITKLSESALEKMRGSGEGPPYCRAGARCIVYKVSDVLLWLESRKVRNTSEL